MIPFVSEEYTISDNVVLTIFDIETIDERTRAVLDENFVLICEGNTGSSLSTVKTRVRNLYSTKNPEWIMGATAEFFVPLYIRLTDFIGLTKANRYKYCLDTEIYTEKLNIIVNSKLRNAIGHNDVAYNTKSQKITYIPNPRDCSRKEEIYLLEF